MAAEESSHHVSIRKISNGYIVNESHSQGDKYTSKETYCEKPPRLELGTTGAVKRGSPTKATAPKASQGKKVAPRGTGTIARGGSKSGRGGFPNSKQK